MHCVRGWLLVCLLVVGGNTAEALERVVLKQAGTTKTLEGKLVVEAQDGGLMLQTRDGQMFAIEPQQLVSRSSDEREFKPFTAEELAERLQQTLPQDFQAHQTKHYLVMYNTSDDYAKWTGALFEKLYKAFTNYWDRRGLDIEEPEFPLVAIVFKNRESFAEFARPEVGDAVDVMIGYYNFQTNYITTYDLTGLQAIQALQPRGRTRTIQQVLSDPRAERLVATVIHEATHQLSYNCGLQPRYTDQPMWYSEGLAMYFESPNLRSSTGWNNIGAVNNVRLIQFKRSLAKRSRNSLQELVAEDKLLRHTSTAEAAYAQAWSLTYFLIRKYPRQFQQYAKQLSKKPVLQWDTPEERVQEFQQTFGKDLETLDREFIRYMRTVRPRR